MRGAWEWFKASKWWTKALIIVGVLVVAGALFGEDPEDQAQSDEPDTVVETAAPAEEPAEPEPVVEVEPEPAPEPEPEPEPKPEPEPQMTAGQENALRSAGDYLSYTAFSKQSLIEQLEFEGFSTAEAKFAANNVETNWRENAVKAAGDYLDYSSFSKQALIEQLVFEGYTQAQAQYGADRAYGQ